MKITVKQLKELKRMFNKHKVEFAYLFGSRATGKVNKSSDYDLAVFLPEKNEKKRFETRLILISETVRIFKNDKVDLVVLNDIRPPLFKFVIIREGNVIFERNHLKRVDFELKTMNEYYDFAPFLNAYSEAYLKKVKI